MESPFLTPSHYKTIHNLSESIISTSLIRFGSSPKRFYDPQTGSFALLPVVLSISSIGSPEGILVNPETDSINYESVKWKNVKAQKPLRAKWPIRLELIPFSVA